MKSYWYIYVVLFAIALLASLSVAEDIRYIEIEINPDELIIEKVGNRAGGFFDLIGIEGDYYLDGEPGEPFLPVKTIYFLSRASIHSSIFFRRIL